jgi:hypothetical protein
MVEPGIALTVNYIVLWKCAAGAVVRLGILRDGDHVTIEVASIDRAEFYR